jgi:hypothetical protein
MFKNAGKLKSMCCGIPAVCLLLTSLFGGACTVGRSAKIKQNLSDLSQPLEPFTSDVSQYRYTQKIDRQKPQKLASSCGITVTVIHCDSGSGTCLLEIRNEFGTSRHGQVAAGQYVSFASDIVGIHGIQIESIGDNDVTLRVAFAIGTEK